MIRTQRHSRFVLMSLDEIRATRDIVLQTEETKSNFSGSGKTVYICEVVRPCDYQKETDTAADKLAAEIERVNADNRALRRKIERLERELPEILMLCVSELAEALEEYRAGKPNIYYNVEGEEILYADGEACEKHERRKPEGVAVELADCMIRILDYCGHAGIDIEEAIRIKHEYNKTRPYRHGGKKC